MENTEDFISDIEALLASQSWKHKKLPPLSQTSRNHVKHRSLTEKEKPRKQGRIITQPCKPMPELEVDTKNQIFNYQQSTTKLKNSLLAVPFNTLGKILSGLSSKGEKDLSFQIPIFPKVQFGDNTKSLSIIPKFANIADDVPNDVVRGLKLESGRITKKTEKHHPKRFEFLNDFNQVAHERAMKKLKTIYFDHK